MKKGYYATLDDDRKTGFYVAITTLHHLEDRLLAGEPITVADVPEQVFAMLRDASERIPS